MLIIFDLKMNRFLDRMLKLGTGLVGVGLVFTQFTFVVDGGEKAIMFDALFGGGVKNKVLGEGMHIKIPYFYVHIVLKLFYIDPNNLLCKTKSSQH